MFNRIKTFLLRPIVIIILIASGFTVAGPGLSRTAYRSFTGQYVVASADAGWLWKLVAWRQCDGTADNIQIQEALTQAGTDGGGVVKLTPGEYFYADPTGKTIWKGTCTTSGSPTTLAVSAWTTGTIADVNVGELLRLSHDGAGVDPADSEDDVIFTVTAKTSGTPDTIELNGRLTTNWNPDTLTFTRVVSALEVPSQVSLEGADTGATTLRMATGAHCSAIHLEDGYDASHLVWGVRLHNFDIVPQTTAVAYDARENGLVISRWTAEIDIRNVSVWYTGGDGVTINHGHGVRMNGDCWQEGCYGNGIVLAPGDEACINNAMITNNHGHAVVMHRSTRVTLNGCWANLSENAYAVKMFGAHRNTIVGNRFYDNDTDPPGLMYLTGVGYGNTIVGNSFELIANDVQTALHVNTGYFNSIVGNCFTILGNNAKAIDMEHYLNSITGNSFRMDGTGQTTIDLTHYYAGCNVIKDNSGTLPHEQTDIRYVLNNTGGALTRYYAMQRRVGLGDTAEEVEICTSESAERFLGIVVKDATIPDSDYGWLQTEGFTANAAVDGNDNIAIGDELEIDGEFGGDGAFELAEAGDYVVAIAESAYTTDSVATTPDIYILPESARYFKTGTLALTATADGLTTGKITTCRNITAEITSGNANHIVTLPPPTVGQKITLITDATGCELRTVASSNVKINNVNSDGTNEAALPADSHYIVECISATEWILRGFTNAGADQGAITPDAA